jgi:hypothetical protein
MYCLLNFSGKNNVNESNNSQTGSFHVTIPQADVTNEPCHVFSDAGVRGCLKNLNEIVYVLKVYLFHVLFL